ncbi:hypothetical protein AB9E35_33540, partial [Rhizobium leguminosarum]
MTRKLLTTVAAGALFATAFAPAAFSQTAPQPADPASPTQAAPADRAVRREADRIRDADAVEDLRHL